MTFREKLNDAVKTNNSLLCIGLDPDISKIPSHFKGEVYPLFTFNKWIIDQTSSEVCAYKPNTAFYESHGAQGIEELHMTTDYIHKKHPHLPLILDAKRGDIGNTNEGYVHFAFEYLEADAITLHPYLGKEALEPFLSRKDKGCIILCRTSNPGSGEFQNRELSGTPLYLQVAKNVKDEWNLNDNCMLVVGATYPEEVRKVRTVVGDMTLLVPGIGAQGGDLQKTLDAGLTSNKDGIILNVSRSILFAENPGAEARKLKNEINTFRA